MANSTTETLVQARDREVAAALQLRINWLNSRAEQYKRKAVANFQGNQIAVAYRLLGQADEAIRVVNELQTLRVQIMVHELVAAAS